MTFALLVLGTLLVDARLTKPRGLDEKELTALAQMSDKAEEDRVKESPASEESASAHGHGSASHGKPASKEEKKEAKKEAKKETDPYNQGEVKVVPEPQKPEQEKPRVDVKVHSSAPLPEDEKVDVTVIVNDTKAKTTMPPKPAVSIDISTKEVVVSDVTETTTTTTKSGASSPAVLSMLMGLLVLAIWSF